ncbi:restriction endonuclease subunit S [Ectothiorhodospira haloalkaliphila]|uniref:restriction endonuclease subunit S n=1 Tax=Ectothiorhodospira haloalkaliphila TaxID=421628 RepID=UPI001EE9A008|nr:restriction endonuclease subunit S [Ectothiorhodospira haloalkaliphila]
MFAVDELKSDDKSSCVAGPFGSSISSKYFVDKGIPVIRGSNLTAGGKRFVSDVFVYVSEERARKYAAQHVVKDDLVFTCWGSIGHIGIIPKDGPFEEYIISNKQLKLRVNKDIVRPLYAYLYFASSLGVDYVKSYAKGAAVPGISLGILKGLEVAVPSLPTQDRIVSLISTYDDLIENNTRRIEILEEMARRLYEEWFVHFRFPGHEAVSFKDSELGRIPEGWEYASLESFGMILTGKTPSKKKPELFGNEVPFIKLPDMHGQIFITETNEGLSREGEETQKKKTVPANAICVSCIGTGGIVVITSEPSQTNQQINTVVPARSDLREFLYFSALSLRDDINNYGSTGATMTNLSRGKFASLKVITPCEEIMSSYSKLTAPMFDRILNLQRANRNLRAQRDLLLPKLVSGEIDVSNISLPDDKEVEAA